MKCETVATQLRPRSKKENWSAFALKISLLLKTIMQPPWRGSTTSNCWEKSTLWLRLKRRSWKKSIRLLQSNRKSRKWRPSNKPTKRAATRTLTSPNRRVSWAKEARPIQCKQRYKPRRKLLLKNRKIEHLPSVNVCYINRNRGETVWFKKDNRLWSQFNLAKQLKRFARSQPRQSAATPSAKTRGKNRGTDTLPSCSRTRKTLKLKMLPDPKGRNRQVSNGDLCTWHRRKSLRLKHVKAQLRSTHSAWTKSKQSKSLLSKWSQM